MMKLITGLIIVSLVGCASVQERQSNDISLDAIESEIKQKIEVDKNTAISPQVLYLLMTAEIAGQRNQYGVALEAYLQAAKRVNDVRISERAAKIGLFLKATDKTAEAVSLWLKQDANNLTARKIAALSSLRAEDKAAAVEHLAKILEDDPAGFESTLIELAKVLAKENKTAFIVSVLGGLAEQHPEQASIYFVQGLLAAQMNNKLLAQEKVDKALEIQPDWNKALILQAQLAAQKGDYNQAEISLNKILATTADNVKVKKMLARVLIKQERFDDAKQIYQSFLDENIDDNEAQFAIALIYLQEEKILAAKESLLTLVNKRAWDAQASFYLGRIAFKNKKNKEALVWFDKVTKGPYVYDASMSAVSVLLSQKEYEEAEVRVNQLLLDFPRKQLKISFLQAEVLTLQNKHQQAFNYLSDALVKYPEHRNLLYTRALVAEKINRLDILESDLKLIIAKHPADVDALNALGYTLADRTERYEEAGKYLMRAMDLKPDEAVIIDSVGWLQFKQGKTTLALETLQKAYSIKPENEIAAHLAEVLWLLGRKNEAKQVYEKTIEKSPDNKYLLEFKRQFLDINK